MVHYIIFFKYEYNYRCFAGPSCSNQWLDNRELYRFEEENDYEYEIWLKVFSYILQK